MSEKKISPLKDEEKRLYHPIKKSLEKNFGQLGECYLETTAGVQHFPEKLKRIFEPEVLRILRVEKFCPDLTGFLRRKDSRTKEVITVEVKPRNLRIKDINQSRLYGEVLKAKHCLLVSPNNIPTEIKQIVENNSSIIRTSSSAFNRVTILKFDETKDEFTLNRELYSSPPEPFMYLAGECDKCHRWNDFLTQVEYKWLCEKCSEVEKLRVQ